MLAWAFWGDNDTGKLAVRGATYKDSFSETAVYGVLSYRKEWYFTEHAFAGVGGRPVILMVLALLLCRW